MFALSACGHQWTTEPPTRVHQRPRASESHRCKERACSAIEHRGAAYVAPGCSDNGLSVVEDGTLVIWLRSR